MLSISNASGLQEPLLLAAKEAQGRHGHWKRHSNLYKLLITLLIPVALYFVPQTEEIDERGWRLLCIFVGTIGAFVWHAPSELLVIGCVVLQRSIL